MFGDSTEVAKSTPQTSKAPSKPSGGGGFFDENEDEDDDDLLFAGAKDKPKGIFYCALSNEFINICDVYQN